jgi:hypothetical protein
VAEARGGAGPKGGGGARAAALRVRAGTSVARRSDGGAG